jgi:hypothetical protein
MPVPALPVWPEEGLPLAEALWRIELDPQTQDLTAFGPRVAVSSVYRQRAGRLCALVREGSYRIKGRHGSLTAPLEEIPASALPYLDFAHSDRSELRERIPNGQRWYDVRLWPSAAPATLEPPKDGSRGTWDWPALILDLKRVEIPFRSEAQFKEYCRENVQRIDRTSCGDGPHVKTVREAIRRHHIRRHVTILPEA